MVAHQGAQPVPVSPLDDLYFFRADNGLVKIGRSFNVRNRLNQIRTSSPVGVMLWAVLEGRGYEESVWHMAFEGHRRSGEWFKYHYPLARAVRLAQNGKDWWKANISEPDTIEDQNLRNWLAYLRDTTTKKAA